MKKILLALFLIMLLSLTVSASDVDFSLTDAQCKAGDSVTLTLTLKCSKDADSFALSKLTYDSCLEFKGFRADESISELCILPPVFDSERQIIVIGLSEAQKFEGVICTVEFTVKESAFSGEYKISADTVAKNSSELLSSSFTSGKITVDGVNKPATPSKPVTPSAPKPEAKDWVNPFSDVKESDWYYSSVKFTNEKGIINGVSTTEFAPSVKVTRAMFVTLLYRLEGQPETTECTFDDVVQGSWYEKAVAWANANGIVLGVSDTEFAPDSNITREQMATILCRWARYKGKNASASVTLTYSDKSSISSWAMDSVAWVTENGVMTGSGKDFLPQDYASRAEAAAVITRIAK